MFNNELKLYQGIIEIPSFYYNIILMRRIIIMLWHNNNCEFLLCPDIILIHEIIIMWRNNFNFKLLHKICVFNIFSTE